MKRQTILLLALALCALLLALALPAGGEGLAQPRPLSAPDSQIVQLMPLPPGYWIRYVLTPSSTTDYSVVAVALLSSGQTWPLILQETGFRLAPEGWQGFCYIPEERGCVGVTNY